MDPIKERDRRMQAALKKAAKHIEEELADRGRYNVCLSFPLPIPEVGGKFSVVVSGPNRSLTLTYCYGGYLLLTADGIAIITHPEIDATVASLLYWVQVEKR